MAYLPKAVVERGIKVRVRTNKNGNKHTDYEAYLGIDPFSHKAIRITRATESDLKSALADFYKRHKSGGDAAVRLTAMQAVDASSAFDALAVAGIKMSLFDVVNSYINGGGVKNALCKMSVGEAWDIYFSAMEECSHKRAAQYSSGKWVATCSEKQLADVTVNDIESYLKKNYDHLATKTYNQHLLYIKIFLNWCVKKPRGYILENPANALQAKPEAWEEPKYMKVEDVKRLFTLLSSSSVKASSPDCLAFAIANFFCGCRTIEVQRMATNPDACWINADGEIVRIGKGKGFQRGKRPRAFHIHPTGLAWINSFDFASAIKKVNAETVERMYALARYNGIPVFKNCGRHTFITYHVAAYGDPSKTQAMVGTGTKMMADNYCGLAIKKDGEAYFNILPSTCSDGISSDEREGA